MKSLISILGIAAFSAPLITPAVAQAAPTATLAITSKASASVLGLPFSADQSVRIVRPLPGGNSITEELKGRIYRSSTGLERFEGTSIATDPAQPKPTTVTYIIDPTKHTALSWTTTSKTAILRQMPERSAVTVRFLPLPNPGGSPTALLPENRKIDTLGVQTRDKLHLIGKRVSATIPAGKIGNEQPIVVTTDVWYSPDLKLMVSEVMQDPRTGNRMFQLTNIVREEPDASLFEAPAGYSITTSLPSFGKLAGVAPPRSAERPIPPAVLQQIADARSDANPSAKIEEAYALAKDKLAFTDAKSLAEEGIHLEELQAASLDLKTATGENFSQMTALSRAWTILGWVYYQHGDLVNAELYTRAAWDLDPQGYLAAHLGRIYEKQHRIPDAIDIYRRALCARQSPHQRETVHTRLIDLSVLNPEPLPATSILPLSSLKVPEGSALFDILLTHQGVPDVLFVSGSPTLQAPATIAIQSTLHVNLPDDGPEKILRRGRVSCSAEHCSLMLLSSPQAQGAQEGCIN